MHEYAEIAGVDAAAAQRVALPVPFTAFLAISLPFFLGARGAFLRSATTWCSASPEFTLSLPVTREQLWAVWLAMTWASAAGLLVIALVFQAGALLAAGGPVPVGVLARTTLLAVVGVTLLLAVLGTLAVTRHATFAGLVPFLIWFLLWSREWDRVLSFLAPSAVRADAIAGVLATTVLACACACLILRSREF